MRSGRQAQPRTNQRASRISNAQRYKRHYLENMRIKNKTRRAVRKLPSDIQNYLKQFLK